MTKKEYINLKTILTNKKSEAEQKELKLIEESLVLWGADKKEEYREFILTSGIDELSNEIFSLGHNLNDLEINWAQRNWTAQDYAHQELVFNNID